MTAYFGTDGIRGRANQFPITAETALRLGQAAGCVFKRGSHRHRVVIGKDTRLSGYMIESALVAGLASAGMDSLLLGPLPTPAAAFITRSMRADLGLMITASHNEYRDNGIKLFGPDGHKLSHDTESKLEKAMAGSLDTAAVPPDAIGRAERVNDAQARYIEAAKRSFPKNLNLEGIRIALDCANGAAYKAAPAALWELGADVVTIGNAPNGRNINKSCGATAPERLCQTVLQTHADIGLAFDGDADRLLVVNEKGEVIDGDQILALLAQSWKKQQNLSKPGVVATILSNLGLERFLSDHKLALKRTEVGDRHIAEAMRRFQYNLGGEKSGHILLSDYATTGDGLISALQILAILRRAEKPASELCRLFDPVPQIQRDIPLERMLPLRDENVQKARLHAQERLGAEGRLVMRKSGTEPVMRLMAEAHNEDLLRSVLGDLEDSLVRAA